MKELREVAEIVQGIPTGAVQKSGSVRVSVAHPRHVTEGSVAPEPGWAGQTPRLERARIGAQDVLLTARGTLRCRIAGPSLAGSVASSNLLVVRPRPELLPEVLVAYMRTDAGAASLQLLVAGTTIPALSPRALGIYRVPTPQMSVQRALAEFWSASEVAVVAAEQIARLRREFMSSVVEAALAGSATWAADALEMA